MRIVLRCTGVYVADVGAHIHKPISVSASISTSASISISMPMSTSTYT